MLGCLQWPSALLSGQEFMYLLFSKGIQMKTAIILCMLGMSMMATAYPIRPTSGPIVRPHPPIIIHFPTPGPIARPR